jgi:hypothetical protein
LLVVVQVNEIIMYDDCCVCSIALIPISDTFSPNLACASGRDE